MDPPPPDALAPLPPPAPDLGIQAPGGAPVAPPVPTAEEKRMKKQQSNQRRKERRKRDAGRASEVAGLISQGDSVLRAALEVDIKSSCPSLSPLGISSLLLANMDEGNLCRVGERVKQEAMDFCPERLKNEKLSNIAMVSAALAFRKAGDDPESFWKAFRRNMEPIVSSKSLHNDIEKEGESALKEALGMNLREAYPKLPPKTIDILVHFNMAMDKLNIVGEMLKLEMKISHGEHMEKENLHKIALMSAGVTYERHNKDLTKFGKDFMRHMKPLISLEEFVKQTRKAGESALKLALQEHLVKSHSDLSSLAIRLLVDANMSHTKLKKVGECFKTDMRLMFPDQLAKEKLSVIAIVAAGLAYERHGRNLKKFWMEFKNNMQPIVESLYNQVENPLVSFTDTQVESTATTTVNIRLIGGRVGSLGFWKGEEWYDTQGKVEDVLVLTFDNNMIRFFNFRKPLVHQNIQRLISWVPSKDNKPSMMSFERVDLN